MTSQVILGQGFGKAVDWWAMGIILYEFLVGVPPFLGTTVAELFHNTVHQHVPWPDGDGDEVVSAPARDLILALLCKSPAGRLGTPPCLAWDPSQPGAWYVKEHRFFSPTLSDDVIDWDFLLQEKACFVPLIEDDQDTSYFDDRRERYTHSFDGNSSSEGSEDDSVASANLGTDSPNRFLQTPIIYIYVFMYVYTHATHIYIYICIYVHHK